MSLTEDKINTIEAMADGSLAESIKNSMRYTVTGIVLGGVVGVVIASFFGKSRMVFGLIGAAGFGASGYLLNSNRKNKTEG